MKENSMIEKYIIQDTKQKKWLKVDRVVSGMDIITAVDYVSSFRAASVFNKESTAKLIIDYIKQEGNYDADNLVVDNVEVYFQDEINRLLELFKSQLVNVVDKDGNSLNDKQIQDELNEYKEQLQKSIEKQFN